MLPQPHRLPPWRTIKKTFSKNKFLQSNSIMESIKKSVIRDHSTCPLCKKNNSTLFCKEQHRSYFQCPCCSLLYVPSCHHLSPVEEKKRYDTHTNHPDDPEYRDFLNRLVSPLLPYLPTGGKGIDYGSGPGPTLSLMFSEFGFHMKDYDPFYANYNKVLEEEYDFLTCSETMEHFSNPKEEWELFLKLVKRGGWIGIMTQLYEREIDFSQWYYKNDPTHVSFYSKETFKWLAEEYNLRLLFGERSVVFFQRI